MRKKILILEDNRRDFNTLISFLTQEFPDLDYYPTNEEENNALKKNVKQLFSPNNKKKVLAQSYLSALGLATFDGILLDYLLDNQNELVNGITLYQTIGFTQKAVVLTKLTSGEFTDLKSDIARLGLSGQILAIQKGAGAHLTARQIEEYRDSINQHLLGIIPEENLPVVVILTALLEEYNAVHAHLSNIKDATIEGMSYEVGIFEVDTRPIAKVYIRECGAKMSNAAQETERAISLFKPNSIFFVGIAGSRKSSDFGLADVVFAQKIYSYEGMKTMKDEKLARPESEGASTKIEELAKKERRTSDWHKFLKGGFEITPQANLGTIASGNQVIEDLDSETGKFINLHYNDTSAVEMEGYAFALAAKKQVVTTPDYAVVRGISDIIATDGQQSTDNRPADSKKKASAAAAAFTYWLIYKMYL